jgi:hypothetical protein
MNQKADSLHQQVAEARNWDPRANHKFPLHRVAAWFGEGRYVRQEDGSYSAVCPCCGDPTVHIYARNENVGVISCVNCREVDILKAFGKKVSDLLWYEHQVNTPNQSSKSQHQAPPQVRDRWGRRTKQRDPIPLMPERPDAAEWPSTPLDKYIRALQVRIKAPWELCAQSILAAATYSVQHLANINIPSIGGKAGERPISCFFVSIAKSGERKSGCDAIAGQGAAVWAKELAKRHKAEIKAYKAELARHEQARKRLAETGNLHLLQDPPKQPKTPLIMLREPNQEGLFKSLQSGQYSQGLYNDEGGAFLGGYGMSSEQRTRTCAYLNKLWDGAPIDRIRKGDDLVVLEGRRFSMHLMLQPHLSDQLVCDAGLRDLGFTARCFVAEPESAMGSRLLKETFWDTRDLEDAVIACDVFARNVLHNLRKNQTVDDIDGNPRGDESADKDEDDFDGLAPRTIHLCRDALDYWLQFHDAIELALPNKFRTIQGFAGKAPEHALRLAAVLTLFHHPDATQISVDAMEWGVDLVLYYIRQHLRLEVGRPSEQDENAMLLLQWMRNKEYSNISLPDICQKGPSLLRKKDKATDAVDACVDAGWLVDVGNGVVKGKKRKQVWAIVEEDSCESENCSTVAATVATTVAGEKPTTSGA